MDLTTEVMEHCYKTEAIAQFLEEQQVRLDALAADVAAFCAAPKQ